VLIEAFLRGRPVVAMGVGGIPDVVTDGVNGLLVGSNEELADALVRLLGDSALAERLAARTVESGERWLATPEEYAARLADLVSPYTAPQ
jgi:glycosyltransferase involved in cell wall biosynthesis